MKSIFLVIALLLFPCCAGQAGERRYSIERLIPPDTFGPGVLEPERKKVRAKPIDEFSRIEALIQNGNLLCKECNYAQAKVYFEKALVLFDVAERREPQEFSYHMIDKAECLDSYADLLTKLNHSAESAKARLRAVQLRKLAATVNSKARCYSNGYTRSHELPTKRIRE